MNGIVWISMIESRVKCRVNFIIVGIWLSINIGILTFVLESNDHMHKLIRFHWKCYRDGVRHFNYYYNESSKVNHFELSENQLARVLHKYFAPLIQVGLSYQV